MKRHHLISILVAGVILLGILNIVTSRPKENLRRDGTAVDLQNLNKSLNGFYQACKRYPKTSEGLRALLKEGKPSDCANFTPLRPDQVSLSDRWGKPFQFISDGLTYELSSETDPRLKTDEKGNVAIPSD